MLGRAVVPASVLALAVHLAAAVWLGRLERGGPSHVDVVLDGAVPATIYLPGDSRFPRLDPPPREERPPGVVLVHGFAADRRFVSPLARRLAGAGYAVLALDARGHGENRNPFSMNFGRPDFWQEEMEAAVAFLRSSPWVDGARLAVMGHSMGAGAALDHATRDSGLDAAVMIAGGWTAVGPYDPPNALFVYAERDLPFLKQRARALAERLAGSDGFEPGRRYGDFARGTAVRAQEITGTDHGRIVWSDAAAREIVGWLDAAFDREGGGPPAGDPRLGAATVLFFALIAVLPGLGLAVGRIVPVHAPLPADGRGWGLVALAAALLATLPLLAVGSPGAVLGMAVGDVVVAQLGYAGVVLLAALAVLRPRSFEGVASLLRGWPIALAGAGVGLVALYALVHPLEAVFHRMAQTPERMAVFAAATLALLPPAFAFNLLLRRGSPASAAAFALAGRFVLILALMVGVWAGILTPIVLLSLRAIVVVFVLIELLAAALYATSRNLLAIALLDAAWLAFALASSMPIRF